MGRTGGWAFAVGAAILMISSGLIGYWAAPGESDDDSWDDPFYQVSTYALLSDGHYEGVITIERLLENGDFGIGTVEGIDGEMIILNGVAYRAGTDLVPEEVLPGTMVPFAMVTHFQTGLGYGLGNMGNISYFQDCFRVILVERIVAVAILIEAEFESLTIRSVPGQSQPYPPLTDVVANQTTMTLHDVKGYAIGFLMSDGLGEINLPGVHLHFLSEDMAYGGHILDFSIIEGHMWVDRMTSMELVTFT